MKIRIHNDGELPYATDVEDANGEMIRQSVPPGEFIDVSDIDPYYLNQDKILRDEVFGPMRLRVEFLAEPDDLVGLPTPGGTVAFIANEFTVADQLKHRDLSYTGSRLTSMSIYEDAARLDLRYTQAFAYSGSRLTSVTLTRVADATAFVKTFTYTGSRVTAIDITP